MEEFREHSPRQSDANAAERSDPTIDEFVKNLDSEAANLAYRRLLERYPFLTQGTDEESARPVEKRIVETIFTPPVEQGIAEKEGARPVEKRIVETIFTPPVEQGIAEKEGARPVNKRIVETIFTQTADEDITPKKAVSPNIEELLEREDAEDAPLRRSLDESLARISQLRFK
jgi:hypothetical protein